VLPAFFILREKIMQLVKGKLSDYDGLLFNPSINEVYRVIDEKQECGFIFFEFFGHACGFHTFILPSRRTFKTANNLFEMVKHVAENKKCDSLFTLAKGKMKFALQRCGKMKDVNTNVSGYTLMRCDLCR
jgi:hypothetical protein